MKTPRPEIDAARPTPTAAAVLPAPPDLREATPTDDGHGSHAPPIPAWRIILRLHLGAGLVMLALVAALGLGPGGFGPYLAEVARFTDDLPTLALYTGAMILYGALVEVLLRAALQRPLTRRFGPRAGVLAPALAYAAWHLRYGLAGALYGLALGLWTARTFHRHRRLAPLIAWHLQWDALALGATLALALASPGPARDAVNLRYKTRLVEAGRLQHVPGWGWVDAAHYHGARKRLCRAFEGLADPTPFELRASFARVDGSLMTATERYQATAPLSPEARLEAAAAVTLHAAFMDERSQQEAPLLSALPMSAWNFEDLPSVQRAVLDALDDPAPPCAWPSGPTPAGFIVPGVASGAATSAQDSALWATQAPTLIGAPHTDAHFPPAIAAPRDVEALARLRATDGRTWRHIDPGSQPPSH